MSDKTKEYVFMIGALLVMASLILYKPLVGIAPYLLAVGSAAIAITRLSTPYQGSNIRVKRLVRMQVYSALLMVAASGLMFNLRIEWVVCMLCAAVFETYSVFAMPKEQ